MLTGLVIVAVISTIYLIAIAIYNKIIGLKEAVYTDEKAIRIQLDERNKLFDSLISTVKKDMKHEEGVFEKIVKLRSGHRSGKADKKTEDQLSELIASGEVSSGINLTMEAYPELKSAKNMLHLQEAIQKIERRLANAKKAFNRSIEDYNTATESFPAVLIVKRFAKQLKHDFERWELSEEKTKEAEERTVSFDF